MTKIMPFDESKYLKTDEAQHFLLNDALETGDFKYIMHALNVVAKARNMTQLAKEIGISRASLYKILEGEHVPSAETFLALITQFGGKISFPQAA